MESSDEQLITQLGADRSNTRAAALSALIGRGMAAAPAFRAALRSADARTRAYAAEGLGRIGDVTAADVLYAALDDSDDTVRAQAATALARLGNERAFDALIRTLGDYPDLLHGDMTLSAYTLIGMGPRVLPRLAPLLKDPDLATRGIAFRIIAQIIAHLPDQQGKWQELWQSLGSYDPSATSSLRDRAADAIRAWSVQRAEAAPDHG